MSTTATTIIKIIIIIIIIIKITINNNNNIFILKHHACHSEIITFYIILHYAFQKSLQFKLKDYYILH